MPLCSIQVLSKVAQVRLRTLTHSISNINVAPSADNPVAAPVFDEMTQYSANYHDGARDYRNVDFGQGSVAKSYPGESFSAHRLVVHWLIFNLPKVTLENLLFRPLLSLSKI